MTLTTGRAAASLVALLLLGSGCSSRPSANPGDPSPLNEPTETVAEGEGSGGNPPGDVVPPSAADSGGRTTPSTRPGAPAPRSNGGGAPGTTTPAPSPSEPRGDGGEPFGATQSPGFPFDVEITPGCIERGTRVNVKLTTRPYAATAAAATYSDNDSYGAYTIGAADPTGVWLWSFVVPPQAPYGSGQIMVSAQDRSAETNAEGASSTNGEGAARKYRFEVKKSC